MAGGDTATPTPTFRGPRVPILSGRGALLYATRTGWRYLVTGREIIGPGDNATFLHDATQDHRGKPVVKLSRARWRRVARRWALLGIPGGLASAEGAARLVELPYEMIGNVPPGWTDVPWFDLLQGYAVGGPLAAGAVLVPRMRTHLRERHVRAEYVYPTWREVCQITGHRYDKREALRMIQLPATFGQDAEPGTLPTPVRVTLPPIALDPGVTKRLERIGPRLGMPGAVVEAHALGSATFIDVAPAALPPRRVKLETLRVRAETADLDQPIIGLGNGGTVVALDHDSDGPHVLITGASGAGKSNLTAWVEGQRMRHGVYVVYLDLKKWSHDYAHGLPTSRCAYLYSVEKIHEGLVALGDELMRRRDMDSREELARMRPIDVVVEEANTLLPALQAYWREERARIKAANKAALADDPYADVTEPPLSSPAVQAIGSLVGMGREFSMFMKYVGQKLSASTFGGPGGDRRESFQNRLLGQWDRGTWNMFAKGVPYVPCPRTERGIWCLVTGGQATIVRVPQVIDKVDTRTYQDTLRAWILSSAEPDSPALMDTDAFLSLTSGPGQGVRRSAPEVSELSGQVTDIPAQRVPLSAAVDKLPGKPLSLDGLRTASKRPGFPAPVDRHGRADLYELPALIEWKARRDGLQE